MRNSAAIEEDRMDQPEKRRFGRKKGRESDEVAQSSSSVQRSKTIAGRKLRVMTVEKGLLRETKIVQKMIDALVECRVRYHILRLMSQNLTLHSSISTTWKMN